MDRVVKEWAVVVDGKVKLCAVASKDFFDIPASCDGSVRSKFGDNFELVDLTQYPGQNPAEGWDWDGSAFSFQFQTQVIEETTTEEVQPE